MGEKSRRSLECRQNQMEATNANSRQDSYSQAAMALAKGKR